MKNEKKKGCGKFISCNVLYGYVECGKPCITGWIFYCEDCKRKQEERKA